MSCRAFVRNVQTSTSRFRFRNHGQETGNDHSSEEQTTGDSFSISSSANEEECELQSMTAKGVQHLCSELLEVKQESDLDLQKSLFANYSVFLVILKETKNLQSEISLLEHQASSQARLVSRFTQEFTLKVMSEDTTEPMLEESLRIQPSPSLLETHTDEVSETLDALLIEHRLDDALSVFEMEEEFLRNLNSEGTFTSEEIRSYSSVISKKRALLADKLSSMAENPRTSASELQKILLGLCQLGENHRAAQLMLQYYHLRIPSAMNKFQSSKESFGASYVQKVSQYVCSTISQAGKCYESLNRDLHELIQWANEEIEFFAAFLCNYISSMPEISSKLPNAIESLQTALSYCSLLENQGMFLKPSLIEHVHPCIEEVLRINVDHFSRVIAIFTSNDDWILDRYYASGITDQQQQPDYFFLTSSGRKFLTLLQSVAADISALITIQMEDLVLKAITDLNASYINILESAITGDTSGLNEEDIRINLPESSTQGVSVLANLSTLLHFSSVFIRNTFNGIQHLEKEIDKYSVDVRDICDRMKSSFVNQFVSNILSPLRSIDHESGSEASFSLKGVSRTNELIPSVTCLELYLDLKKIQKLDEDELVDSNWLMILLQEIVEASLEWMSSQSEMWGISKDDLEDNRTDFLQFMLDAEFLVEVARSEGCLTDKALGISFEIFARIEESFVSSGLSPPRDPKDADWLSNAAAEAFRNLQQLHEKELIEDEENRGSIIAQEETEQYGPFMLDHDDFQGDEEHTVLTLGEMFMNADDERDSTMDDLEQHSSETK